MNYLSGWDSASLLNALSSLLHLRGTKATWWHMHGARLVDALGISSSALLLVVVAWIVWQRRNTLFGSAAMISEHRLWIALVTFVFAGTGLIFAVGSLPNKVDNARRLATMIAKLPGPIYTDQFTADQLSYLLRYTSARVRNAGSLDDGAIKYLLVARQGCIIINEPELDELAGDRLPVSQSTYMLLRRQLAGWRVVARFPSADNALEFVVVTCAADAGRE